MYPSRYLPKGFTSKRNVDLAPLFSTLDESGSLEQLQVFGHRIESSVERCAGLGANVFHGDARMQLGEDEPTTPVKATPAVKARPAVKRPPVKTA